MEPHMILWVLLHQNKSLGLSHNHQDGTCSCLHCGVETSGEDLFDGDEWKLGAQFPHAKHCHIKMAWDWMKSCNGVLVA